MSSPVSLSSRRLDLAGLSALWCIVFALGAISGFGDQLLRMFPALDHPPYACVLVRLLPAVLAVLSARAAIRELAVRLRADAEGVRLVFLASATPIAFGWAEVAEWYDVRGVWEVREFSEGRQVKVFQPDKSHLRVRLVGGRRVSLPLPVWPFGPADRLIAVFRAYVGDREKSADLDPAAPGTSLRSEVGQE